MILTSSGAHACRKHESLRSGGPAETSVAGSSEIPSARRGGVLGADRQGPARKITAETSVGPPGYPIPLQSSESKDRTESFRVNPENDGGVAGVALPNTLG